MWHGLDSEEVLEQDDSNGHAVSDAETLLMQITTNLASGACKFTFPGFRLLLVTYLIILACIHCNESADNDTTQGDASE